ncbi:interleukin-4 [Alligator sinensis]|uniref:Interleukin-4 n=1 Tax=Alligator sinensis TaxID=38654 RepID=A0A1U7RHQ0_ALLSI|nr:interleukin-4 [Alligator sinensis]
MGVRFPVIVTCFCLLACNPLEARHQSRICWYKVLQEIIRSLNFLKEQKVSCKQMNVSDIFEDPKENNQSEMLCKAAAVLTKAQCFCQECRHLKVIRVNLLELTRTVRCPVNTTSNTTLHGFLERLTDLSQMIMKQNLVH